MRLSKFSTFLAFLGLLFCALLECQAAPAKSKTVASSKSKSKGITSAQKSSTKGVCALAKGPSKKAGSSRKTGPVKKGPTSTKAGSGKKGRGLELFRRTYSPLDANTEITLYHGTLSQNVDKLNAGIKLISKRTGDFSTRTKPGFYLTDRLEAAVQFACLSNTRETSVAIFEYRWNPAKLAKPVHQFSGTTDDWKEFVQVNWKKNKEQCAVDNTNTILEESSMIAGPMDLDAAGIPGADDKYAKDFWQYTLVDPNAIPNLESVGHHTVACTAVRRGALQYQTQGPSSSFPADAKAHFGL